MRRAGITAGALSALVGVVGCGSSATTTTTTKTPAATTTKTPARTAPAAAGTGEPIAVKASKFGPILGAKSGRTVYLFEADKNGKSACAGACASVWPPVVGSARAGKGVRASLISSTVRADGTRQVTYGGNPIYYYAADKDSGDAYGEGLRQFGADWYAVGANGKKVEKPGG